MASEATTDLVEAVVPRRELSDLFDNEALWDADDTDEYILKIASELEVTHAIAMIAMRDAGGNSLLHVAAIWNRPKVVEALIRTGVELNLRNSTNQTALDLAMHYGNAELGLQLRHYGSKHTCESERDLAIAQRDLAQQQLQETDAELTSALERLKHAKLEREAFRVERDRVAHTHATLVADLESLVEDRAHLQQAIDLLQTEKQQLLLQLAQLKEALQCEQSTRQNAVQSWQLAQTVIAELQEREDVCREREEEALRVRNEALKDRDLALEQLRLAQLDQGIAKQTQLEAEREREEVLKRLLAGEAVILAEKERWALKLAKVDEERRNIQHEINRQTTVLRTECERLEKQLAIANNLAWNQREELADKTTRLAQMESRLLHSEAQRERLEHAKNDLETRVQLLEDERRDEYKTWRNRIQESQRLAVVEDMHRMLTATISTWEAVANAHQQALLLDTDVFDDALKPILATSLTCEKPAIRPTTTSSCSDRGLNPLSLPALPSHSPVMAISSIISQHQEYNRRACSEPMLNCSALSGGVDFFRDEESSPFQETSKHARKDGGA
ncbi:hypothetical protein Poli38472_009865 [Pythium oligandrum]|uniref:Uncharacterized protein n=1 Tax=Pythium oligandrum TaxID=41045 RepID=A0A8K1FK18_PYTOL|nr:hypothetical protein Poli38472_009865 [Pythium oligandrum]|eukprot:TMW62372.1 hypothetical protein Poli38472_009865 [Pythium oligandrum]